MTKTRKPQARRARANVVEQTGDEKILALLRQWIELRRAADRVADDSPAEWERLLDQADEIKAQIAAAKPSASAFP
jgi:hypothetical protein